MSMRSVPFRFFSGLGFAVLAAFLQRTDTRIDDGAVELHRATGRGNERRWLVAFDWVRATLFSQSAISWREIDGSSLLLLRSGRTTVRPEPTPNRNLLVDAGQSPNNQ